MIFMVKSAGAGGIFRMQEHTVKICGEGNHTKNQNTWYMDIF